MKKESIVNMIDKRIVSSLVEGHAIRTIQDELDTRMERFSINAKENNKDIDLSKLITSGNVDSIYPTKLRYQVIYIKESLKRIKDLNWLVENKSKFPQLSNSQIFKLIILKEKLSEENALPF